MSSQHTNCYLVHAASDSVAQTIAQNNNFMSVTYTKRVFRDGSVECIFENLDESNMLEADCAILYYRFKRPFDSEISSALRLVHYLKQQFKNVILLTPFMPFLREHIGSNRTNSWFLFQDIKIITIDAHVAKDNLTSLPPVAFSKHIASGDLIILPDRGACRYLGLYNNEYIQAKKDRENGVMFESAEQISGRDCVILDDIVDTGYTLINTMKQLKLHNCGNIKACIAHYFLPKDSIVETFAKSLGYQGLEFLYIYDTVLEEKSEENSIKCAEINNFVEVFSNLEEKL